MVLVFGFCWFLFFFVTLVSHWPPMASDSPPKLFSGNLPLVPFKIDWGVLFFQFFFFFSFFFLFLSSFFFPFLSSFLQQTSCKPWVTLTCNSLIWCHCPLRSCSKSRSKWRRFEVFLDWIGLNRTQKLSTQHLLSHTHTHTHTQELEDLTGAYTQLKMSQRRFVESKESLAPLKQGNEGKKRRRKNRLENFFKIK